MIVMPASPVKTRSQLKLLTKNDLLDYAVKIGDNFTELTEELRNTNRKYDELNNSLFDPVNGIIAKLQGQLAVSQSVTKILVERVVSTERQSNMNAQYSRKETAELHGVPDSFGGDDLEKNILKLFNDIKPEDEPKFEPHDIHACHRLAVKSRVIVKFVHRKRFRALMTKRASLKNDQIKEKYQLTNALYLNESMSAPFKKMFYLCKKLQDDKHIISFWFFNGNLNIRMVEKGTIYKVAHESDIAELLELTMEEFESLTSPYLRK